VLELTVALPAAVGVFFRSRHDTAIEILALRQQISVLKRKPPRWRLNQLDRLFWTTLRRVWSRWAQVLVVVKPETVVGWHRAGFRLSVARHLRAVRHRGNPGKHWLAFLQNHREVIVAFNFSRHPASEWIVQRRLVRDYVTYFDQDCIHDFLEKDTPNRRTIEHKPSPNSVLISNARLGGPSISIPGANRRRTSLQPFFSP
jgi:hypothetical protein